MVNQRVSLPLLAGRLVFYAAGQLILCIGIILNTKTGLGVAPINSLPYLTSETTALSLGQATTILYLICILAQCLMRRKIKLSILLQLPFSYLFGWLIDVFNELLDVVQPSNLVLGAVLAGGSGGMCGSRGHHGGVHGSHCKPSRRDCTDHIRGVFIKISDCPKTCLTC